MVRNYISNDIDLVQPTQYPTSRSRAVKKPLLALGLLFFFKPLPIYNNCEYGKLNLLKYINNKDPWQIFKLFQTDELVDRLIEYINKNIELHPFSEDKDFLYRWTPISRQKLYAYLAVLIYIGLYIESTIKDYWHKNFLYGTIYVIQNYIRANRQQQINYYFYCTKPRYKEDEGFKSTFKKIKELSKKLYFALMKLYKPRIHLTVNKIIQCFTGHVPEIVNILTKPMPEALRSGCWLIRAMFLIGYFMQKATTKARQIQIITGQRRKAFQRRRQQYQIS